MPNTIESASLNLVDTFDEAESFMRWLGERRDILGCDTETGGLDWWRDPLRLVQFGDLSTGWSIPWQMWGGLAAEALRRYRGDIVFHNMKFDVRFLELNGCEVDRSRCHDTATMANLLYPTDNVGLKYLGVKYVDSSAANGEHDLKRGMAVNRWTWATVPVSFEPYWVYSALDPVITCHLYSQFEPKIREQRLTDVYELEIAANILIDEIERRGVRVDLDYCREKRHELLEAVEAIQKWSVEQYGFAPGSNSSVAAQLQRDGIVLTKKTGSGAYSVDKSVLEGLDHPLARATLDVRQGERSANSYFGNYIDMADGELVHCDIKSIGADTGRMSVSRPALQQIPRTKLLHDTFIPRDGNKLVSVDFDQMEMRLAAHFSEDAGIIAAIADEGDLFTNMAHILYGDPTITKDDERRQNTKHTSYTKLYGGGVAKIAERAGISEEAAQAFVSHYDSAFPGLRALAFGIEAAAKANHESTGRTFIHTRLGRMEEVPYSDQAYKLTNYLIQGSAADIFKQTMVDLDRAGLAERMVLPIHDEALFDVPTEDAEEFAAEAVRVFEDRGDWRVKLTSGSDILDRWGTKYA